MTAQIPVMITNKMRGDLRALGLSEEEISQMTPAQAWERLGGMPPAGDPPSAPPEELTPLAAHVLNFVIHGQSVNGHSEMLGQYWGSALDSMLAEAPNGERRTQALSAHIAGRPDAAEIIAAVLATDLNADLDELQGQPEEPPGGEFALMPELPEAARLDPALGAGVARWLDDYIDFSRQWSPRAYDGFHTACALWILSTVAARRVIFHMGKDRFTNLYIALTARTSLYVKSSTAEIALQVIQEAGLSWLLAADNATPQKFISDLTTRLVSNYDDLTEDEKDIAKKRVGMAGQRGWYYDEFGQHVAAMMREGGFMADFHGLLRRMDDTPIRYEYGSIGRGSDVIERPYLALLANLTPDDLRPFARRGSGLWGDGFLARYALITPPEGERRRERFPKGERRIPAGLIKPLSEWNQRLGLPEVTVSDVLDKDDKPTGDKRINITPRLPEELTISDEVREAFYCYGDGLLDLLEASENHDLDGNYARLAEKALRIAALLASLDGAPCVTLPYWARAQAITEDWRAGLHRLYDQINEPPPSKDKENEEKLLQVITRHGSSTAAEAARFVRGMSSGEASLYLDGMARAGLLEVDSTQRKTKRYGLAKIP